jgi:hypothetical protein
MHNVQLHTAERMRDRDHQGQALLLGRARNNQRLLHCARSKFEDKKRNSVLITAIITYYYIFSYYLLPEIYYNLHLTKY